MDFRFASLIGLAALASGFTLAQTLPEQKAAAAIAGGLAHKAAPSGVNAAKKARTLKEKADTRFNEVPNLGPQWADPMSPVPVKQPTPKAEKFAEPAQKAAPPAPAPPAEPWTWRLKGVAGGQAGRIAVFEAPDGRLVWAKAGESLDKRSKVVRIDRHAAIVQVDKKPIDIRPW